MDLNIKTEKSISMIIKEWAMQSTSHGIPKIASSPYTIIKIMWTIFFVASFGFCSYCLINSFREYFKYDVNTQMSVTTQSSLEFPTITFCNKNPFKTDDTDFEFRSFLREIYNKSVKSSFNQGFNDLEKQSLFLEQVSRLMIYRAVEKDQRNKLSYDIDEMLISCSFNLETCNKDHFSHYWSNTYGNCYQFNNGKNYSIKSSTNPGKMNGLKLDLYAAKPKSKYSFIKSNGIIIFIHNSSTLPIMTIEGLSLPTGFETDVKIKKVSIKRLPSPHNNCVDDFDSFELYKKTKEINTVYTQKFCIQLCYQEYLIENCKCYEINSFDIPYSLPCGENELFRCVYPKILDYFNSNISMECLKKCPQECDTYNYEIKTSQAIFPTPFYADLIMNYANNTIRNLTKIEEIKETCLSVSIYFDELTSTVIEEQPNKTPIQLVSDLGGSCG